MTLIMSGYCYMIIGRELWGTSDALQMMAEDTVRQPAITR